jgi:Zinc finger, C3HC4 type (RING finger)
VHREKQIKNLGAYKDLICYLLQEEKSDSSAAPVKPSDDDEDLECPVCFEDMLPPMRIFACHNGHLLCSICLDNLKSQTCPICRDDLTIRKPVRAFEAEERAKKLNLANK